MKRRALLVGVENYDDDAIENLKYACDDAYKMKGLLARLGFETTCLSDRSQSEVLGAIANSTRDLKAGDLFLFFFSGHGFSIGTEDLMFYPEDRRNDLSCGTAAGLSYAKVKTRTERKDNQFNRVFLFDTCRSFLAGTKGVAEQGDVILNGTRRIGTRDLNPVANFVQNVSGSVFVLRSCRSGEQALELPDKENDGANGNGLFTRALFAAIERDLKARRSVYLNQAFYDGIRTGMEEIRKVYRSDWVQMPEFAMTGETLCLWEPESEPTPPPKSPPPPSEPAPKPDSPRSAPPSSSPSTLSESEAERVLRAAVRHMQMLCGSPTVGLSRNRADKELRDQLGAVRIVFYNLDRDKKKGNRRENRYADSEIMAMTKACRDLEGFLQTRPVFLARECRASVCKTAKKLLGTQYAELAKLMLSCIEHSAN